MKKLLKFDIETIYKESQNCENPKYCIINENTFKAINSNSMFPVDFNSKLCTIYGLNIAICNALDFGEFEIR